MRAVVVERFGPPEVMRVVDVADPPAPRSDQVLVAVRAAGVNPVETYIRAGAYSELPGLPYTPGGDGAGTVVAVGDAVAGRTPGDRVFTTATLTGAYAELALCRATAVHELPESLSFAQGAALGTPYSTACRALFQRGRLSAGERVLVRGASGGVGLAAVQLATAAGATVTGTAGSAAGRDLVVAEGADAAVDHSAAGVDERLLAASGGRGFDLVVELLANVNLGGDLRLLAPRGRVVVVGSRGTATVDPRDLMNAEGEVLAMRLPNATADERAGIGRLVADGLAAGSIRPVVATVLAARPGGRGPRRWSCGGRHRGKIVLEP